MMTSYASLCVLVVLFLTGPFASSLISDNANHDLQVSRNGGLDRNSPKRASCRWCQERRQLRRVLADEEEYLPISAVDAAFGDDSTFGGASLQAESYKEPPPLNGEAALQQADEARAKRLFSRSWRSPYVTNAGFPWTVHGIPECEGRVPSEVASVIQVDRIWGLPHLGIPGLRTLVYIPSETVMYTLAAWDTAFVFSLLASRRIVLFQGGPDKELLSIICAAFDCGEDMMIATPFLERRSIWRKFMRVYGPITALSLEGGAPAMMEALFASHHLLHFTAKVGFDDWWRGNSSLAPCVFAALQCADDWCLRSRALNQLLQGGPMDDLGIIIEQYGRGIRLDGAPIALKPGRAVYLRFDVAIHIRTFQPPCLPGNRRCARSQAATHEHFFDADAWRALHAQLALLAARGNATQPHKLHLLNIFLATDNDVFRSEFIEVLRPYGAVFFLEPPNQPGANRIGHEGISVLADLYLLSRADTVIAFMKAKRSIFAETAAYYGNGTFLLCCPLPLRPPCDCETIHEAPPPVPPTT
eukprot:TRINITY_DN26360_c0_g1_i1.p1 TRINITY_DN26360_c0_g1~~TRINITY_DN26360_c0_g1_i1.p1  ORF type:complete len:529 (-),score=73.35 TRINITY_DN26360_c0_g1_i1:828-2414(-)